MNRILDSGEHYQTYRDLPPLAGIGSIQDAMKEGLSVEACVNRLKRYHYAFKRLHEILNNHIPSEPIYELKMAFSLHSYICAEHVAALRKRIGEMREPPLGLDKIPHPSLQTLFDEILKTPDTKQRILGIYEIVVPALFEAMQRHIEATNVLVDQPSVRVCRFALLELTDLASYGEAAVAALVSSDDREAMAHWLVLLTKLLSHCGGLDGTEEPSVEDTDIVPVYSGNPYRFEPMVKRDERFFDPYNMGVNAEAYLYEPEFDDASKVVMMFYKRLREIDVPEVMASIIAETPGKPWNYYLEMSRQLWDEARHAMMGEIGFLSIGIEWPKVPINFNWSLCLNTQLKALERHAVLYFIEQGLMPKSGKRYEWEVGVASRHPLAGLFQDYDWADEVLHAHIGRRWYVSQRESAHEAVEYGDKCWSKVFIDWNSWQEQGLTEHKNWWPEIYQLACRNAGIEPVPEQFAFDTSYQSQRADLKTLPAE